MFPFFTLEVIQLKVVNRKTFYHFTDSVRAFPKKSNGGDDRYLPNDDLRDKRDHPHDAVLINFVPEMSAKKYQKV